MHQQHFELGKLGSPSEDLPEGSSGCLTPEVVASSPSGDIPSLSELVPQRSLVIALMLRWPAGGKLSRKAKLPREGAAAGKLSVNSGPCDHCGRKHSPAWRKGPPQAPRLCNACGTHFAHRKSLEGYLPGMKQRGEQHSHFTGLLRRTARHLSTACRMQTRSALSSCCATALQCRRSRPSSWSWSRRIAQTPPPAGRLQTRPWWPSSLSGQAL